MSTPKGYPCQHKSQRTSAEFTTVQPITPDRFGLDVISNAFTFTVDTDAVDSYADAVITAAGHKAIKGDVIRFTSGALDKRKFVVWSVDTDTITLAQNPNLSPSALDTFAIERYTPASVTATGALASSTTFIRNGVTTDIVEDTVNPANNRPLPVKLTGFDGDVSINASNLNLDVQLTAAGANPDSVRIGDGTNTLVFGAGANSASVLRTTPATDAPHLLATRHEAAATPVSSRPSNGTNFAAFGAGANDATVMRTTPATDAPHLLATRHEAAATPISVRLSDGSTFPANGLPGAGRSKAHAPTRHDYTSNVTTAAYTQLVASTSATAHKVQIFDSSGQTLVLAFGAGGAEVDQFFIFPGGVEIDYLVPVGTRVSIKAVSANATSGECSINFLT